GEKPVGDSPGAPRDRDVARSRPLLCLPCLHCVRIQYRTARAQAASTVSPDSESDEIIRRIAFLSAHNRIRACREDYRSSAGENDAVDESLAGLQHRLRQVRDLAPFSLANIERHDL